MQYTLFQQNGLPTASSIVESANKFAIEARLKGTGIYWERHHIDPMLALRNIICCDRWNKEWTRITKSLRSQSPLASFIDWTQSLSPSPTTKN